jgi:hypothetical protein
MMNRMNPIPGTSAKKSIPHIPPDGKQEIYDSDSDPDFQARDEHVWRHHEYSPWYLSSGSYQLGSQ